MLKHFEINDITFDYLIARSGIIGRQILRFCRYINTTKHPKEANPSGLQRMWLQQHRLHRFLVFRLISRFMVVFYTYYIGGSLTRSDQLTFARLFRMNGEAYRLTLYNALFCGIPCAMGYFLLGEGFYLLKSLHSYAELPSLLAQHTSLAIGVTSLAVDLFRLVDAAWHRRCWAPFGALPFLINFPTYLKRFYQSPPLSSNKRSERAETSTAS